MSRLYERGPAEIRGNMTPMIDMTFLLIVFFVLVSRIISAERVKMELPRPVEAHTEAVTESQRTVINVLPGENGNIRGYRLGSVDYSADAAGRTEMMQRLTELYQRNPNMRVNLRADRASQYEYVQPALELVSAAARNAGNAAGAAHVNLVVVPE
ncbi:MAG TPA: biopolymer transporter ExbD [Phycisphaerales bacterium]|nr:biopolymer transporter ExbD [Phycisphaerales bacterium]